MVCHFFYAVSVFTLYILQQILFSCVLQHRLRKTQEWPTGQKRQVDLIITALMFQEIRTPFTIKFLCKNFRISEKSSTLAWFFTNHRMYN